MHDESVHELLTPTNFEEAERIQEKWAKKFQKKNLYSCLSTNNVNAERDNVRFIAGVDVSYPKNPDPDYGLECCVLWDKEKKEMIEHKTFRGDISFPYRPGFLGFREVPLMKEALERLENSFDLVITDGHGIIHPKHFGEAVHLGLILGKPTYGSAKAPFYGNIPENWKQIPREKGNYTEIYPEKGGILDQTTTIGYAIVARKSSKPIFISPGYKTNLSLIKKITLEITLDHRNPEPVFLADHISRKILRSN